MQGATHYIEQVNNINKGKPGVKETIFCGPHPISMLENSLKNTLLSRDLITVAVFKIKMKN